MALHETARRMAPDLPGPLDLHSAVQRHPRQATDDAFSPWTATERRDLDLLYRADLAALQDLAAQEPRLRIWQGRQSLAQP